MATHPQVQAAIDTLVIARLLELSSSSIELPQGPHTALERTLEEPAPIAGQLTAGPRTHEGTLSSWDHAIWRQQRQMAAPSRLNTGTAEDYLAMVPTSEAITQPLPIIDHHHGLLEPKAPRIP